MYGYIYLTTNTVNGKIYVGQHKSTKFDNWYIGSGVLLHNAIEKYGRGNFTTEIIDTAESEKELSEKEISWIEKLDSRNLKKGYNLAKGGKGNTDRHWTDEQRKQLAERNRARRGCKLSEEHKKKISATNKGRHWTMSEANRKKLSEAKKGRKLSEEQKRLLRKPHKHTKWSSPMKESTRRKISEAGIGNKNVIGKVWMHNESKCTMVCKEEVKKYMNKGFKLGRLIKKEVVK